MAILQRTQSPSIRPGTWRRPQIGLHLLVLALLLVSALPLYLMIDISFKTPLQYLNDRFIPTFPLRVTNYSAAWSIISTYIWNTLYVALVGFLGMLVLSVIGAYVFARMRFPLREPLYYALISLLMVPWIISFIPTFYVYFQLGMVNTFAGLIVPNIAGGPVFGIFLLRAAFSGLPEEMYEAARVDGAGIWPLIWRITLPLSGPPIAALAVLNFLSTWNSFLWPLVMISDKSRQVISIGLYLLSSATGAADTTAYGPLFAAYVISSVPLVVLFFVLGKFYVEGLVHSGLKM